MDYGDEKSGVVVVDIKRLDTDDSDVENSAADVLSCPAPAAAAQHAPTRFTVLGWQISAQRAPQEAIAKHQILRKPVASASAPRIRTGSRGFLGGVATKFGQALPKHRRYCFGRLSRRALLIVAVALLAAVLALSIGLGVGLAKHSGPRNLPLPTNADQHSGDLTYYMPGLGACGITSSSNDSIAAVSHYLFDAVQTGSNPNANPLCGKRIRATRFDSAAGAQRSVDVTVVDRCVGCQPDDLDVTTAVFDQLADEAQGRVDVTWTWLDYDG